MRTSFVHCSLVTILLSLAGCASSDPVPGFDAGRSDAGSDAGRDLGEALPDLGTDLGAPDLGAPDLGNVDMGPPAAEGDTCAASVLAIEGNTTDQTTRGYTNDYEGGAACAGNQGLDRVYRISVPNGQRLTALVSSHEGSDLSVSLLPLADCAAAERTCVSSSDHGSAGQADIAVYDNTSGAAVVMAIVVDNYDDEDMGGDYDLSVTLSTPPTTGDTCGSPTVISGTGSTLSPETLIGYRNDYESSGSCISLAGADHVYSISVPADRTLSVSATPFGDELDISLNIIVGSASACAEEFLECADGTDTRGAGETESIVYANTSGETQNVFILVDSYDSRQGTYQLTTSVHVD